MQYEGSNPGQSTLKEVEDLGKFVRDMIAAEGDGQGALLFDSATVTSAAMQHIATAPVPAALDRVLAKVDEGQFMAVLFDGVQRHCREYGRPPAGDVLDAAIGQAGALYDAANSGHHDQLALVPAAPQIALLSAMATPVPFAGNLYGSGGVGNASNELRLIIVSHSASNKLGGYEEGESIDGVAGGKTYFTGDRDQTLFAPNDGANYKFAFTTSVGGTALPLLRGRCKIWVNGQVAALESRQNAAGKPVPNAPLAGSANLNGNTYNLSGAINHAGGEIALSSSPALPVGTQVTAMAYIDFESDKNGSLTPAMMVNGDPFSVYANPYRGMHQITPEAAAQFAGEVGVDPNSEALIAMRTQLAQERHYQALKLAYLIGRYADSAWTEYDFAYPIRSQQMTRAQIWYDFAAFLGVLLQRLVERCNDQGTPHLYVTQFVCSQMQSLGREIFEPSGIAGRPTIYRVGRLFGLYEVYYTPRVLSEINGGKTCEVLLINRSHQPARCPIIMGEVGAAAFKPMGVTPNAKEGFVASGRLLTQENPHPQSAQGCALFTIKNMI